MDIVAALFIEGIELRQVPGPSTRIDLTGVQFSAPAPAGTGHDRAPPRGHRALPTRRAAPPRWRSSTSATASRSPATCSRSRSSRASSTTAWCAAELEFADYGTVEAHCRLDLGPVIVVPFTLLPPV